MNPFDLHGFAFLFFYIIIGAAAYALLSWSMNRLDPEDNYPASELAADPYLVAYLRAGPEEAVRIATFSLIDRGLLLVRNKTQLQTRDRDTFKLVRRPIERAILTRYLEQQDLDHNLHNVILTALSEYQHIAQRERLLPDAGEKLRRWLISLVLTGGMACIAVYKINLALSQGSTISAFWPYWL